MMPKKSNSQESGEGKTIEKDEFLNDDGKSSVMTMGLRPLANCSRLELEQLQRHD